MSVLIALFVPPRMIQNAFMTTEAILGGCPTIQANKIT